MKNKGGEHILVVQEPSELRSQVIIRKIRGIIGRYFYHYCELPKNENRGGTVKRVTREHVIELLKATRNDHLITHLVTNDVRLLQTLYDIDQADPQNGVSQILGTSRRDLHLYVSTNGGDLIQPISQEILELFFQLKGPYSSKDDNRRNPPTNSDNMIKKSRLGRYKAAYARHLAYAPDFFQIFTGENLHISFNALKDILNISNVIYNADKKKDTKNKDMYTRTVIRVIETFLEILNIDADALATYDIDPKNEGYKLIKENTKQLQEFYKRNSRLVEKTATKKTGRNNLQPNQYDTLFGFGDDSSDEESEVDPEVVDPKDKIMRYFDALADYKFSREKEGPFTPFITVDHDETIIKIHPLAKGSGESFGMNNGVSYKNSRNTNERIVGVTLLTPLRKMFEQDTELYKKIWAGTNENSFSGKVFVKILQQLCKEIGYTWQVEEYQEQ